MSTKQSTLILDETVLDQENHEQHYATVVNAHEIGDLILGAVYVAQRTGRKEERVHVVGIRIWDRHDDKGNVYEATTIRYRSTNGRVTMHPTQVPTTSFYEDAGYSVRERTIIQDVDLGRYTEEEGTALIAKERRFSARRAEIERRMSGIRARIARMFSLLEEMETIDRIDDVRAFGEYCRSRVEKMSDERVLCLDGMNDYDDRDETGENVEVMFERFRNGYVRLQERRVRRHISDEEHERQFSLSDI